MIGGPLDERCYPSHAFWRSMSHPPPLAAHDFANILPFRPPVRATRCPPQALDRARQPHPPASRARQPHLLVAVRQSHPLAEPSDRAYQPHPLASSIAVCAYRPRPPSPAVVHACRLRLSAQRRSCSRAIRPTGTPRSRQGRTPRRCRAGPRRGWCWRSGRRRRSS